MRPAAARSPAAPRCGAWACPRSLRASVYRNTASSTKGSARRSPSPGTCVTAQAPTKLPASAATAAGASVPQFMVTRRAYWPVAQAVPQTDAPLFVPKSVAGAAAGYALNSAGTRIRPPPPTMASTNPARAEAAVTSAISTMQSPVAGRCDHRRARRQYRGQPCSRAQ